MKQESSYDKVVNLYFDMFNKYIDTLSKYDAVKFIKKLNDDFKSHFGIELFDDNFKSTVFSNRRLASFFIKKVDILLRIHHNIASLSDHNTVDELFFNFYDEELEDIKVQTPTVSSDNIELPKTVNRYDINSIISEFCYDILNHKVTAADPKYGNSKKLIIAFCYFCVLSQFNKKYVIVDDNSKYDFTTYLKTHFKSLKYRDTIKGDLTFYDVKEKDKVSVINRMTDCFSHISGNFNYIPSTNTIEIKNRFNSTYTLDMDEFITDMDNLFFDDMVNYFKTDNSNSNRNETLSVYKSSLGHFLSLIKSIQYGWYESISRSEIIFLMGYLELCFNKEATLDNQIMSQYSLVYSANFSLEYGLEITDDEKANIELFKTHKLIFVDSKSEELMNKMWGDNINYLLSSEESKGNSTLCNINTMCYDETNDLYFPTSEVVKHLRNSLRHGRYYLIDDDIIFYDQKDEKDSNSKYFFLRVSVLNFLVFLQDNVMLEAVHSKFDNYYDNNQSVIDYKSSINHRKNIFYDSEMAYARNSFSLYLDICRTRFPGLSNEEFVAKLYENNLFSKYLAENPDKFDDFFSYIFDNGDSLIEILQKNHGLDLEITVDKNLSVINMKNYISDLLIFEKSLFSSNLSVYFPLYVESILKNSLVENVDVKQFEKYDELIKYCINYRQFLIGAVDLNSVAADTCMLSIALNSRDDLSESDKIVAVMINAFSIKNKINEKGIKEDNCLTGYSNYKVTRSDSKLYLDSSKKIVNKLRSQGFFYKNISYFFDISGIFKLGMLGLLTLGTYGVVTDVSCMAHTFMHFVSVFSSYINNKFLEYNNTADMSFDIAEFGENVIQDLDTDKTEILKNMKGIRL